MESPIQLLEIEKELSSADGEVAMRRHDAVLSSLDARLSEALSKGLTPEEFDRAGRLQEAVVLARKLLRLTARKAL